MQTELESLISALRAVPFEPLKLFPETKDSTLDWPYEDKYSFHLQAYALKAFEQCLDKTLTAVEFKELFEEKMQIQASVAGESYVLNGVRLFTVNLKEDVTGNLYHYFQPKI